MKVALITGAGSGIGRHTALHFLENKYTVILAGRTQASLEETARLSSNNQSLADVQTVDVTDPDSVRRLFSGIQEKYGRLDVLFNNAGVSAPGLLLEDLTFDHWQNVISTNLTGVFLCTQAAFNIMKAQQPMGGRIINNGSISAQVPRPNSAPYTASKHAITGLTKSTALDGRKYNIACGQIDIGNAATDMVTTIQQGILQANGTIASEPTMNVKDVAKAVFYMADLPLDANVQQMTVMATTMPFVGRG